MFRPYDVTLKTGESRMDADSKKCMRREEYQYCGCTYILHLSSHCCMVESVEYSYFKIDCAARP